MNIKYPNIEVEITGSDGNAFTILAAVRRAMREAGLDKEIIAAFTSEAQAGDYDHLLSTVLKWVTAY